LSILRPEYLSNERDPNVDRPGAFITSYRILFSVAVGFLGTLKATMTFYSNIPTTVPIWFEWFFSGLILSVYVNLNLDELLLKYTTLH